MTDERDAPSGGWRAVYREMGVSTRVECDDPVAAGAVDGDANADDHRASADERDADEKRERRYRDARVADD